MKKSLKTKPRRTLGMVLIAILFGLAALLGGLRVYGSLEMQDELMAASESINIPYLVISGVLTCLGGLVGLVCIFLRQIWAQKAILVSATVLSVLYWFDQVVFVENTIYIDIAWGFSLVVNVLSLGVIAWVLTRKRVQAYYQGNEVL